MPILFRIYNTLRVNKDLNTLRKIKFDLLRSYRQERNHPIHGPIVRNKSYHWVLVSDYHMSGSDTDKHWTVRLVDPAEMAQGTFHVYMNKEAFFWPTGPQGKTYQLQAFTKPFPV